MKKIATDQLKHLYICLLLIVQGSIYAQSNAALTTFVQSSNLKYASIGIKVTDLKTGKSHCSYNENQSLVPASTMKIITTASALEILGEKFTYKTTVYTDGEVDKQGVLNGNIYIKGSGDPTLGSEYLDTDKENFLKDWLTSIQKKGIKSIQGSVIALDDLYGYEGISSKWIWEDLGNYYASGTYGISIFDNTYRLYLKSGASGTQPEIQYTDPEIEQLKFENHLKSSSKSGDSAYIYGIPFSYDRKLYGSTPANKRDFVIKGNIPDPGFFLASYFTSLLRKNNIQVVGEPSTPRLNNITSRTENELISTQSPPLKDIIRIVNFKSNNHYAEHIYYALSKTNNESQDYYMPGQSTQTIREYWTKKGLDTKGLFMQDGCGLSPSNAVSAKLLTDILVYMNSKSSYPQSFMESLPRAGKEGTVQSLLKGTALEGKAQVKSGSISGVLAYAGFIEKDGKKYAFSIIINNFTGSRTALRSQIETFLLQF